MKNPYLNQFQKLQEEHVELLVMIHLHREELVKQYSWAIPSKEAIARLVHHSPIIEIGAGTGYWASLIEQMKGEVLAFDLIERTMMENSIYVRTGSVEQIPLHPVHTLFLCWPPYNTPMAFNCLMAYKGETVIYVGEGPGGFTANEDFFIFLEANYDLYETIKIPQYPGINDAMFIFRRKPQRR